MTSTLLPVADQRLSLDQVVKHISGFPSGTVRWYDLGGASDSRPDVEDKVTLFDLGRMTAMNPDLSGSDAVALLQQDVDRVVWDAVPHTADLADADPAQKDGLFDAADRLHKSFSCIRKVKDAKTSKLLHLKRPNLYPILDRQVKSLYKSGARAEGARPEVAWRGYPTYWGAIRRDLLAWRAEQAFDRIRQELQERGHAQHALLSDVRLLDITAWSLASKGADRRSR